MLPELDRILFRNPGHLVWRTSEWPQPGNQDANEAANTKHARHERSMPLVNESSPVQMHLEVPPIAPLWKRTVIGVQNTQHLLYLPHEEWRSEGSLLGLPSEPSEGNVGLPLPCIHSLSQRSRGRAISATGC